MRTLIEILLFGAWGASCFWFGTRWERMGWHVVVGNLKHDDAVE